MDLSYVGSYQLVSDSAADPIQIFQPPSFYPKTPYVHQIDLCYTHQSTIQNPEYNQQYCPSSIPYQQQYFHESAPLPNFRCNPSSHKVAVSVGVLVGNAKFNPWQLQQLGEIRILVQQAMTQLESLQLSLNKCSNRINQIQFATKPKMFENSKPKAEMELVVKAMKTTAPTMPMAMAPAAMVANKLATPSNEAAPSKKPFVTTIKLASSKNPAIKKTTPVKKNLAKKEAPVKEHVIFDIIIFYFQFRNIVGVESVFERVEYKLFDVMLERSENKFVRMCVFVFDPGGWGEVLMDDYDMGCIDGYASVDEMKFVLLCNMLAEIENEDSWLNSLRCIKEFVCKVEYVRLDSLDNNISGYYNLEVSEMLKLSEFLYDEVLTAKELKTMIDIVVDKFNEEVKKNEKVIAARKKEKELRQIDEKVKYMPSNKEATQASSLERVEHMSSPQEDVACLEAYQSLQLVPKKNQKSDFVRIDL